MPLEKKQWNALVDFLPKGTLSLINQLLHPHRIRLVVTLPRSSILGYYKPPKLTSGEHMITINKDLNPYAFFIILLHEIAHLQIYLQYGRTVKSHGQEWQKQFGQLLSQAVSLDQFPHNIKVILNKRILLPSSLHSCTDIELMRELKKWDDRKDGQTVVVENIPIGGLFEDNKGRQMKVMQKKRTRFLCQQQNAKQHYYFFPAMMEVKKLDSPHP